MRCFKWDCSLVSLFSHSSSGPDMPSANGIVCAAAVTITMIKVRALRSSVELIVRPQHEVGRFPPPWSVGHSPSTRRRCSSRISSAMLVRKSRTSSANGA
jgi:hypothetical protein